MSPQPLWAPWRLEYIEHADEQAGCIFCEPAPEALVHSGDEAVVILNRFPYSPGHLLVAPHRHVADLTQLTEDEALDVHRLATRGITALRAIYAPQGFNLGWNLGRAAGGSIEDHVHLHVVPRWSGDTSFMPVVAETKVLPEALTATREKLVGAWR